MTKKRLQQHIRFTMKKISENIKTFLFIILFVSVLGFESCNKEKYTIYQEIDTYVNNFNILPDGIQFISIARTDTINIRFYPITEITAHSARATGSVDIIGDLNNFGKFKYGICWDTILRPNYNNSSSELKEMYEDFSFLMYDLKPETNYNVCLFIENLKADGNIINIVNTGIFRSFTTLPE